MGVFDKINKGPVNDLPYDTVEGGFLCDRCWQQADDARYYFGQHILSYICPNGHKTTIEKFTL